MNVENHLRFVDIINRLSEAESLDQLENLLTNIRQVYNIEHVVYHAVYLPTAEKSHAILLPTYDQGWVQRYKENNYFDIDPVVKVGTKSFLPLDWSDVDRESKNARSFFDEADRFGVGRKGITFPVRGLGGERALFTITSNASDHEWGNARFMYMREFQIIAHYFHDIAVQINGLRAPNMAKSLSPRELECLQFAAHGLAAKQTAGRLKISDSAVRLYLRSACYKVGCASINQAIAKLVALEIIHP